MNFSKIKNIKIPEIKYKDIRRVKPYFSTASGSKCKKALANKAPAEKLTNNGNICFNLSFFINNVKIPIKEIMLTINTLIKLLNQTPIFLFFKIKLYKYFVKFNFIDKFLYYKFKGRFK